MVVIVHLIDEELILRLKKIGLTEYESRAYVSLVGLREATAREVLEVGKIPQGRVYDVLKNLADKGYIEIQNGYPTYYRAVAPSEVIQNLNRDYIYMLQELENALKDRHIESPPTYPVWTISNETAISNRVFALLKTVDAELIVYTNNPDFFRPFVNELRHLGKKSRLYIIVDDPGKFPFRGLEFRQANKEFLSIVRDFNIDGVVYSGIFSMIVDGKESLDVLTINGKRIGIVTKLPIIHYLHRRLLSHLHMLDDNLT